MNIVSVAGGLGNQMFQYAFYLSLKNKWFKHDINHIYIAPYELHNGYELDAVFDVKQSVLSNLLIGFVKKNFKKLTLKNNEITGGSFQQLNSKTKKRIIF